jgi:hypothetical protein
MAASTSERGTSHQAASGPSGFAQIPTGNRNPSDMRDAMRTVESSFRDPSKPNATLSPGVIVSVLLCRSATSLAIHASGPAIARLKKYRAAVASSSHSVGSVIDRYTRSRSIHAAASPYTSRNCASVCGRSDRSTRPRASR